MIVKVQQSLATNGPAPSMLIYNKTRDIWYEADLTDEVKRLLKGRPKAYFKAKMLDTRIQLEEEVKNQDW